VNDLHARRFGANESPEYDRRQPVLAVVGASAKHTQGGDPCKHW